MFGPREIMVVVVVLVVVLLIFGPKRMKSLGSELGNAIKGFRTAVRDRDAKDDAPPATDAPLAQETATGTKADAKAS